MQSKVYDLLHSSFVRSTTLKEIDLVNTSSLSVLTPFDLRELGKFIRIPELDRLSSCYYLYALPYYCSVDHLETCSILMISSMFSC